MGSKPFRFDRRDLAEVGKVMAVAGISAALVAGFEHLARWDWGAYALLVTAGLTAAIKAVQQWAADNTPKEPQP
jgi:hypothetical protein